jgi:hypothetical protein
VPGVVRWFVVASMSGLAGTHVPRSTPAALAAGVQNPVQIENAKAGTRTWRLTSPARDREIEGYASLTSVSKGGTIHLLVSTSAPSYQIDVYRMGWYGGLGARQVAGPIQQTGRRQPMPAADPATGLIDCNWTHPYALTTANARDASDWPSGVYLAKLTARGSQKQSYVIFVVREDARRSDFLFQSSVTTMQAYNNWGGKSLYTFNSVDGRNATKVSFNRPYGASPWDVDAAQGVGAGEFLTNVQPPDQTPSAGFEYNMVRFLEREGYDVTYATNLDTHRDGASLMNHRGFLSVGHDEYWSWAMRNHVEAARGRGVGLGFFSGNSCYWQVRFEPSPATRGADRVMVCYKGTSDPHHADPATRHLTTDKWRRAAVNRSEDRLMGVMTSGERASADYVVKAATSWVFAGTNLQDGDTLARLAGYETDQIFPNGNSPPGTLNLAEATYPQGMANMVTYPAIGGGTVFATGSIFWSWGLDEDYTLPALRDSRLSPAVQQITRNVLARFQVALPPITFTDAFATTTRDATKWTLGVIDEGRRSYQATVPISQGNGTLTIRPLAATAGMNFTGYDSAQVWDLTGRSAAVQVLTTTHSSSAANTILALSLDSLNWYRFVLEGGSLHLQQRVNGVKTNLPLRHDTSAHAWWRIRHVPATDLILWETSADGATWTVRRTEARLLDIVGMTVELQAGTYQSETNPGVATFGGFALR